MTQRHIGFGGTQRGMTDRQLAEVERLLQVLVKKERARGEPRELWGDHGDCVGADRQFHDLVRASQFKVALHPPTNPKKRAFCEADVVHEAKPYLLRNQDIVAACVGLIAAPATSFEDIRSGTWSTVRYARRMHKPRVIVFPDGAARKEAS